jgi:hypothetical protein
VLAGRSIHLVELSRFLSHVDVESILRRAGYSQEQIEAVLRDVPDPVDTDRDSEAFFRHGISIGSLMDRRGGSP